MFSLKSKIDRNFSEILFQKFDAGMVLIFKTNYFFYFLKFNFFLVKK